MSHLAELNSSNTPTFRDVRVLAAGATALAILVHLALWLSGDWGTVGSTTFRWIDVPLALVLAMFGLPLIFRLLRNALAGEFDADLVAAVSMITSVVLGEHLAGTIVLLMATGGEVLEAYAVRTACSALAALAKRLPATARRLEGDQRVDVPLDQLRPGDLVELFPHATCPADGTVETGHGSMDESFLTGEPFQISKAPGTSVLAGAVNGNSMLVIRVEKPATDSRYSQIISVMEAAETKRPPLRRIGDQLGTWYTPLSLGLALISGWLSGDPRRFLAVLVAATPCPLLIGIPVAIVGAVSLCARRGIVIKDPAVLEAVSQVRTVMFDKTGTLTYGMPRLEHVALGEGFDRPTVLIAAAALEQYSKHPLAEAVIQAAREEAKGNPVVSEVRERPGEGLCGQVDRRLVEVIGRGAAAIKYPDWFPTLPPRSTGLECLVVIDGRFAGLLQFRDTPRTEGPAFVSHLSPSHHVKKVMLVTGDQEGEARFLAQAAGIVDVHFSQSPEQKLALVRSETEQARTLYLGDGINDAPALAAATVGVAFGQHSDVTAAAAGVVILDSSLRRLDELIHIGGRMRTVVLQTAVGGMAATLAAMIAASFGWLPPVGGAIAQEAIDVIAILNALRTAWPPRQLADFDAPSLRTNTVQSAQSHSTADGIPS